MAKNDVLLLDGIIDDRVENNVPSNRRDEAFEYLAFEQILKSYDLSEEEIIHGSIDGRNDGGIDGFFIFVNGHLLIDVETFTWPKSGALLEIFIITCKHHDTFKQATLDSMVASLSELLDLSLSVESFQGDYSEEIIELRENLKYSYRKLSPKLSNFKIQYIYASRGDINQVGESIVSRSDQIVNLTKESFGVCEVKFQFVGASELVDLHRKIPNFSLELPFSEVLSSGERYVLLVNLSDYYGFVSDDGKLRRYLFDSNVRDFMGLNRVNEDIRETLEDDNTSDFWCLNNGVTILADSASVVGDCINLEDIQIVNGLQTTESIFRYFETGGKDKNKRSVLIKVIVSQNEDVRDSIIRATNNQTSVEMASLHATDKIQRDIEDIFKKSDYFYERRKNHHVNLGNPASKIITPLYLASGYVNLILKSPKTASILKARFMRSEASYNRVFSEKSPLLVYPIIAAILKITDHVLEDRRPQQSAGGDGFLKRWRQILSFITVSRLIGDYGFSAKQLSELNIERYNYEEVNKTWDFISQIRPGDISTTQRRNRPYYIKLCREAAENFSISGLLHIKNTPEFNTFGRSNLSSEKIIVNLEFAKKVDEILPTQPWRPGVHKQIIEELKCSNKQYSQAIQMLIDEGSRNTQIDGVVYDKEGNVLTFDSDRVNPDTLELLGK